MRRKAWKEESRGSKQERMERCQGMKNGTVESMDGRNRGKHQERRKGGMEGNCKGTEGSRGGGRRVMTVGVMTMKKKEDRKGSKVRGREKNNLRLDGQ